MLCLSRKFGESIMIGDDIEVQVVRITPTTVQLGIVAPLDVSVWRKEVLERINRDKESGDDAGTNV